MARSCNTSDGGPATCVSSKDLFRVAIIVVFAAVQIHFSQGGVLKSLVTYVLRARCISRLRGLMSFRPYCLEDV